MFGMYLDPRPSVSHLMFFVYIWNPWTLNEGMISKEGVSIIKCPHNGLFHDRRYIIIMSQMAASQISPTMAVN